LVSVFPVERIGHELGQIFDWLRSFSTLSDFMYLEFQGSCADGNPFPKEPRILQQSRSIF